MFGKIRYISDGSVALEFNKENSNVANLMNLYIVFESESVRLLAEVKSIDEELLLMKIPYYSTIGSIPTTISITGTSNIGNNAFKGASLISSISLPDSVTSINSYALYGCTSILLLLDI